MAKTRYKQNIYIDGELRHFLDVSVQLDAINDIRTGRAVLNAIMTRPFDLVIKPWTDKTPGAVTSSEHFEKTAPAGQPLLTCGRGSSGNVFLQNGQPVTGTGEGSNVFIDYSPDVTRQIRGPGRDADEILFHELCHALRRLMSLNRCEAVGEAFDNIEEFFAILMTNIYRSESGRTGLRGDHSFDDCPSSGSAAADKCLAPMNSRLTNPAAFYTHFKNQMEKLFIPMASLGREIAVYVTCDFNPLEEYAKWHWGMGQKVR